VCVYVCVCVYISEGALRAKSVCSPVQRGENAGVAVRQGPQESLRSTRIDRRFDDVVNVAAPTVCSQCLVLDVWLLKPVDTLRLTVVCLFVSSVARTKIHGRFPGKHGRSAESPEAARRPSVLAEPLERATGTGGAARRLGSSARLAVDLSVDRRRRWWWWWKCRQKATLLCHNNNIHPSIHTKLSLHDIRRCQTNLTRT